MTGDDGSADHGTNDEASSSSSEQDKDNGKKDPDDSVTPGGGESVLSAWEKKFNIGADQAQASTDSSGAPATSASPASQGDDTMDKEMDRFLSKDKSFVQRHGQMHRVRASALFRQRIRARTARGLVTIKL